MKTLVVIRHAKSSWDDPALGDFDRPLNKRGQRDAPSMGQRLQQKKILPQLMITSPANRALTTCKLIAQEIGYDANNIEIKEGLYHAGMDEFIEVVRRLNDNLAVVYIFGHNPGLTEFVDELTDERIDNIPTTGVAVCELHIKHWNEAKWGCGQLVEFDYPKKETKNWE